MANLSGQFTLSRIRGCPEFPCGNQYTRIAGGLETKLFQSPEYSKGMWLGLDQGRNRNLRRW